MGADPRDRPVDQVDNLQAGSAEQRLPVLSACPDGVVGQGL